MSERWSKEIEAYEDAVMIQRICEDDMESVLRPITYFATNAAGLGWTKMQVFTGSDPVGEGPFFNADWFASGKIVATIITRWQEADVKRRKAWEQIPPEDRVDLEQPSQ